jgi:hypothetical protein
MDTFDEEVLVRTRSGLVLSGAALPLGFGAALVSMSERSAVGLGALLIWLGMGAVLYVWARNPCPMERIARAAADRRGLLVDGQLLLESARIRGGWLETRAGGPPVVHVRGRKGWRLRRIDLVVRDVERGRALLRALEIDPTHVAAQYWVLARPLGEARTFARAATLLGLVLAIGIVVGQRAPAALALSVMALVVAFLGACVPMQVVVGADGVLLRWLGGNRFVAWASIESIEDYDGGVILALEGGRWITLALPAEHERHQPERDAMLERMRVAWRAHGRRPIDEPAASMVRRAGGHTREWVRALRGVFGPERGYRSAEVPQERLWRVVEDPSTDRTARTGAALALAPTLDDAGRERMQCAAASCAEPKLRLALRAAASEAGARSPDDELAATLDAFEADVHDEEEDGGCLG